MGTAGMYWAKQVEESKELRIGAKMMNPKKRGPAATVASKNELTRAAYGNPEVMSTTFTQSSRVRLQAKAYHLLGSIDRWWELATEGGGDGK